MPDCVLVGISNRRFGGKFRCWTKSVLCSHHALPSLLSGETIYGIYIRDALAWKLHGICLEKISQDVCLFRPFRQIDVSSGIHYMAYASISIESIKHASFCCNANIYWWSLRSSAMACNLRMTKSAKRRQWKVFIENNRPSCKWYSSKFIC